MLCAGWIWMRTSLLVDFLKWIFLLVQLKSLSAFDWFFHENVGSCATFDEKIKANHIRTCFWLKDWQLWHQIRLNITNAVGEWHILIYWSHKYVSCFKLWRLRRCCVSHGQIKMSVLGKVGSMINSLSRMSYVPSSLVSKWIIGKTIFLK